MDCATDPQAIAVERVACGAVVGLVEDCPIGQFTGYHGKVMPESRGLATTPDCMDVEPTVPICK